MLTTVNFFRRAIVNVKSEVKGKYVVIVYKKLKTEPQYIKEQSVLSLGFLHITSIQINENKFTFTCKDNIENRV